MSLNGGRNCYRDYTGQKFGLLTAISRTPETYRSPNGRIERHWILECECGEIVKRSRQNLKRSKTCGSPECRNPWISKIWDKKRELKGEEAKISSTQKAKNELEKLIAENMRLKSLLPNFGSYSISHESYKKLSQWHKLQQRIKALRVENAKIELELGRMK